jgi:hypothetical protein
MGAIDTDTIKLSVDALVVPMLSIELAICILLIRIIFIHLIGPCM